jgi:hypothetical protein
MSFARDAWALRGFNKAVEEVLAGAHWRYRTEEESSGDEGELALSAHYDPLRP